MANPTNDIFYWADHKPNDEWKQALDNSPTESSPCQLMLWGDYSL